MGRKGSFYNIVFYFVLFVAAFFVSCSNGGEWESDLDAAKKRATEEDKKILLVFTGYDWNSNSYNFKSNIMEEKSFKRKASKKYVLVNLDYNELELKNAEKDSSKEVYEKNFVRDSYAIEVSDIPCAFLLSAEGFVLGRLPYEEGLDSESFLTSLESAEEDSYETQELLSRLNSAESLEKVLLIDTFIESSDTKYSLLYDGLVRQVLALDSYNQTGLLGKYELEAAYRDALACAHTRDEETLCRIFTDVCANGHLDQQQKQEAYYTAAMVLAYLDSQNYDMMSDLLQNAIDADPESENAKNISLILAGVKQYAFVVKINSTNSGE